MRGARTRERAFAGFTLVELLTVMVIIAVLGAIAFPVLVKAKETAKISECLSNMRELGGGLHMYLDDYSLRFPAAVPWGSPSYWRTAEKTPHKTIQELLKPYVRSGMIVESGDPVTYSRGGVFRCPSDFGIPTVCLKPGCNSLLGVPAQQPIWKYTGCSYEYYASNQEDWLDTDSDTTRVAWTGLSPELSDGTTAQRVGAPLSMVYHVSKKAVLGDVYFWHAGDRVPDGRVAWRNTLFADGHAFRVKGVSHLEARLEQLRQWHTETEVDE